MDNIYKPYAPGKGNNKMFDNFKYLWRAKFANGHTITQHPQDLYSKHDPNAEHNPSSFRDYLEYAESHPDNPLVEFSLFNKTDNFVVDISLGDRPVIRYTQNNKYGIQTKEYVHHKCKRPLKNIRPIYFRRMELDMITGEKKCLGYTIGFQGNEPNGNNYQKKIDVS